MSLGKRHPAQQPLFVSTVDLLAVKPHPYYDAVNKVLDRDAADGVRKRGNDAVHRKPDTGEAMEVVRQTLQVLDALEKTRR